MSASRGQDRVRVAWILPAFPRDEADPLVPYWGPMAEAVAQVHDLDIVPLRFPSGQPSFNRGHARIHPLPHGNPRLRHSPRLWGAALDRLRRLHREQPFDVIHALHGNEAGFLGALASRMLGLPLAVHLGGGETVGFPALGYGSQAFLVERWQVRTALQSADCVTVGSRAQARLAAGLLPAARTGRVVMAPVGIHLAPYLALGPGSFPRLRSQRLLSVAEFNAVKDHETLLRAVAPWALSQPELRLELVGGGPRLAGLRRMARDLGIAGQVAWRGQIPNGALPLVMGPATVFGQSTVFVHAARHESQGLALIEAAAAGLPIACTRVGVAEELAPAGTALAAPGDVPGLSRAIGRALAWAEDGQAPARAAALRDSVHRFDLPEAVGTWFDLYADLAARRPHDR